MFPGTQGLCGRISGHLGRATIHRGLDTHSIQTGATVPLLASHAGVTGQIPFKERLAPLKNRFQNHQVGLSLRCLAIPTCHSSVMPTKQEAVEAHGPYFSSTFVHGLKDLGTQGARRCPRTQHKAGVTGEESVASLSQVWMAADLCLCRGMSPYLSIFDARCVCVNK